MRESYGMSSVKKMGCASHGDQWHFRNASLWREAVGGSVSPQLSEGVDTIPPPPVDTEILSWGAPCCSRCRQEGEGWQRQQLEKARIQGNSKSDTHWEIPTATVEKVRLVQPAPTANDR